MFSKRQVLAARPEGSARTSPDQCKPKTAFFRQGQAVARGGAAVALLGLVLGLSACGDESEVAVLAPVEGFAGLVSADEPNATVVGREVLGNGGTAADAATD